MSDPHAAWMDTRVRQPLSSCPACAARAEHRASAPHLGERETEALTLAASGMTAAQIARTMTVEKCTVKTQLGMVRQKFGVTSTTAAVAAAIRAGVIE